MSDPSPPPVPDPKLPAVGDVVGVWGLLAIVVAPAVAAGVGTVFYGVVRPAYLTHLSYFGLGVGMVGAVVLAARSSGLTAKDLGLVPGRGSDLVLGMLWAALVWVTGRLTVQLFPGSDWPSELSRDMLRPVGGLSWALATADILFLAFAEELVYRGYLLTVLRRMLRSTGWAVAVSTTLFAVTHVYQHAAGVFGARGWPGWRSRWLSCSTAGCGPGCWRTPRTTCTFMRWPPSRSTSCRTRRQRRWWDGNGFLRDRRPIWQLARWCDSSWRVGTACPGSRSINSGSKTSCR